MEWRQQNIYDDMEFFDRYSGERAQPESINALVEEPEMAKLLPDLTGKTVLDLGCGFGNSSRDFVERGAEKVVAIDIALRMIEYASAHNAHDKITYRHMDMYDAGILGEQFDFVYSSLAFHYIAELAPLAEVVARCVKPGGELLFSQEHPIKTACKNLFYNDANGKISYFALNHYLDSGYRKEDSLVARVEHFHRTMSEILNTFIEAGFIIEKVVEPAPTEAALKIRPSLIKLTMRPDILIVKARRAG